MSIKIAINGFGRIGRCIIRAAQGREDLEIVAINDLTDTATLTYLLKYDSVHGRFKGTAEVGDNAIIVNGKPVKVYSEKDPAQLPWKELGIDMVMECTGRFTSSESASKHIQAGAKSVLISAPAKDAETPTFVYGVNHTTWKPENTIFSNASCTTNCLSPFAKVLSDTFGIKKGLMTTVHAYTNDQVILDQPHKDLRRGRAAALSMIPTSTGAAKAVGLVLPELKGKLDGLAVRVPTPNVSLVDLVCECERPTTKEEVNNALFKAAEGPLKGILHVSTEPLVSIDWVSSTYSSIVDSTLTKVIDGNLVKVMAWYDNEMGFSYRMVDLASYVAGKL